MPLDVTPFWLSGFHVMAAFSYKSELQEMIESIRTSAEYAAVPPDTFIPPDIAQEYVAIQSCLRQLLVFNKNGSRPVQIQLSDAETTAFAAALALAREDLDARVLAVEANMLAPAAAVAPLHERQRMLQEEFNQWWNQATQSIVLNEVREHLARKRGRMFPRPQPLTTLLRLGEGQAIEFMQSFPRQAHDLAKELAAFGTSNPGTILLGVYDDGTVIGIPSLNELTGRDDMLNRIAGVSTNSVSPSLPVRVAFDSHEEKTVVRISVPKGSQPIYSSNGQPYVRHLAISRPASPHEVIDYVQRWLDRPANARASAKEIAKLKRDLQKPIKVKWG